MKERFDEDQATRRGLRRLALALAAMAACGCVAACNTTKGIGEDVEAAGEGIQDVADDAKDAMKK